MNKLYLLPLTLLVTSPALAELGPEGLSGRVTVLVGQSGQESNFDTDTKIKQAPLNSAGKSDSQFVVFPLGQARYTFGENNSKQLYVGTSADDIVSGLVALELGYKTEIFNHSALSVSFLPSIISDETWEDPFVTGQERKVTDESGNALRVQYFNAFNTDLTIDTAIYDRKIDDEQSGTTGYSNSSEKLDRNGKGLYARVVGSYSVPGRALIIPSFRINRFSADGDAMSNTLAGVNITYRKSAGKHSYALSGDYSYAEFDEVNPVFGKTQNNSNLMLNFVYDYQQIMGWKRWGFNAMLGYNQTDANITFYDTQEWLAVMGLSYKF